LSFEALEDRRLLALTDWAAIGGSLVYELPAGQRLPISSQPVCLYRDGNGNQLFEGSPVDPLVATRLTDSAGEYRFDGLTAGTYHVVPPPEPSGELQPPPVPEVRTILITPADAGGTVGVQIDQFETRQSLIAQLPPLGMATVGDWVPTSSAVGGHRKVVVRAYSGEGKIDVEINESGVRRFSYSENVSTSGRATVVWDGTGGDPDVVNTTGLGGVDLTGGGRQSAFVLNIHSTQLPPVQTFIVYTDATHASYLTLPAPAFTTEWEQILKFSDFVALPGFAPADFQKVGAVEFRVEKDPDFLAFALDYDLDRIDTIGPTLFPAHFAYPVTSGIGLEKRTNDTDNDAAPGPLLRVGSRVTWTYLVTNHGNESITDVVVTDDQLAAGDQPRPVLARGENVGDLDGDGLVDPSEVWVFAAEGVAVAGQYANLGMVTGVGVFSETDLRAEDRDYYYGVLPEIDLIKAGAFADENQDGDADPGETIRYRFAVTNTGNVTLTNVILADTVGGVVIRGGPIPVLPVGATDSTTYTGSYALTQADIDAGTFFNLATVTGTDTIGQTVTDDDDHREPLPQAPAIELLKTGAFQDENQDGDADPGETIGYRFTVTNTGNVTLTDVTLADTVGGVVIRGGPIAVLPVGAADSTTFTGSYALTQADIDAGSFLNLATVTGTDTNGRPVVDDDDHREPLPQAPRIDIEKATNGLDADEPTGPVVEVKVTGTTVTWTYVVTNPGNVPLADIVVTDDDGTPNDPTDDFQPLYVGGDVNGDGRLDLGESWHYRAVGSARVGLYGNAATASGRGPAGQWVHDMDPSHYFGFQIEPVSGQVPVIVLGPDKSPWTPQAIQVVDETTWQLLPELALVAYENDYVGGTRVAVGDLDGDGLEEIITAPGRNRAPEVRMFTLEGDSLPGFPSFLAYEATFRGGVELAVADVNGDGKPDMLTVPSYGAAAVHVFFNHYDGADPSAPAFRAEPDISFLPFGVAAIGGATVAAADMGRLSAGAFVNETDGRAEIVVGTGGGTKAQVAVYSLAGTTPVCVGSFVPFATTDPDFLGGVSLAAARLDPNAAPPWAPADIIVGMGVNGTSRIEVWKWNVADATLALRGAIPGVFAPPSDNAPVRVTALDGNSDGVAETILAVQGPIGTAGEIQRLEITAAAPFQYQRGTPLAGVSGPWFIAASAPTDARGVRPSPILDPQGGAGLDEHRQRL